LLGFAFHPRFAQNHQVFLYWVGATCRLSRFTMDPAKGLIDPSSETVLLELPDPNGQHHGGQVQFGPDGFLYLSIGDLGPQHDPNGFAQAPDSLRGKMLRIDPDHPEAGLPYGIPAGNPFVGRTSPAGADLPERPWRPEIWALGLRNVYRFSFDRKTGALWGADVGQNTQEEIDIIERGANYGWNAREGTVAHPAGAGKDPPPPEPHVNHPPFTEPVFAYGRAEGVSITGGYVYQGKRFPWLKNKYVYADWGSSRVMYLQDIGMGVLQSRLLMRVPQVTSFFETAAGELRLVSMSGDIYELSDRPARKTKAGSDITGGTSPPTDAALLEEKSRDPAVVRSGRKLFGNGCHLCHGANGEGAIGPNLRDETWLKGSRMVDIVNSIAVGSAYGGMPAWNEILSPLEIEALAAFVTSLGGVQGQGTAPNPNPN
jgi:glucose/arabinose dehydrogenase/mono/diheme cytochrome c family protein